MFKVNIFLVTNRTKVIYFIFKYFFLAVKYMQQLRPDDSKIDKIHDGMTVCFIAATLTCAITFCIYILVDADGVTSLVVIFPNGTLFMPLKFAYIFIHVYVVVILLLACNLIGVFSITYCFYVTIIYTVELNLSLKPNKYRACNSLRNDLEKFFLVFRAFQVLHQYLLAVYGLMLLIFQRAFMYMVSICNVVLFCYWDEMEPFARAPVLAGMLLSLTAWTLVLEFGRIMFSRGTKTVNSWSSRDWKTVRDKRLIKKFKKSCKPLLLGCGTVFVIKRATILNFSRGVARGTMRLLLASRGLSRALM